MPISDQPSFVMVFANWSARSYVLKVFKHLDKLPGCQPYTLYFFSLTPCAAFSPSVHVRQAEPPTVARVPSAPG